MVSSISRQVAVLAVSLFVITFNTTVSSADDASTKRIQELEERVAQLEALITGQLGKSSNEDRSSVRANNREEGEENVASAAGVSDAVAAARSAQDETETRDPTINQVGQEAFIARDNVPTLSKRKFEFSSELTYVKNQGQLQSERGVMITNGFRYGLTDILELGVVVPAYFTRRSTQTGPGSITDYDVKSLGDITLNASYLVSGQKPQWPGVSFSAGVIIPTGKAPYVFAPGYRVGQNPSDVLKGYQSTGHWGVKANVQFFKTVDPVVLFWGGGLEYLFSKRVAGHTIDRGLRYSANAGVSMALSEKTTIASTLNFYYSPEFEVDGNGIAGSASESINLRTVLIQRIGESLYLEPSLVSGLSDSAADVVVGLGVRKRW